MTHIEAVGIIYALFISFEWLFNKAINFTKGRKSLKHQVGSPSSLNVLMNVKKWKSPTNFHVI